MITLTDLPFSPSDALASFQARAEGAGAIVSFIGLVRDRASDKTVSTLHLQAYSPMTERGMQNALDAALTRWPLTAAQIIHRTGDMAPAEPIVFVATASAHRRAAFEAADFLMDYLKTEAVFWKKEVTSDGERWIEPRTQDYRDNARWKNDKTETA
ncbi:molybdenum cofactor biosynthesis protein MoaE [Henriciella litoralis]|uniref:molybdenum cofactor biosynthesis protein MoaE n=1 Tax=Henriciella litoralis TaxID=568102 RepID=UPI000A057AAB|nr:molybdenum cofactor biosynthesis protein MoaE [Henriciella litoralis]